MRNFKVIGTVVGLHVFLIGAVVIANLVEDSGLDTDSAQSSNAGVNGLTNWSNQDESQAGPSVNNTGPLPFDSRAGDLTGYNDDLQRQAVPAESKPMQIAANNSKNTKRYTPRRPEGGADVETVGSRAIERQSFERLTPEPMGPQLSKPLTPGQSPSSIIEYKVVAGDSLWGISKRYGTNVNAIKAVNPGINVNSIRPGQTIRVPKKGSSRNVSPTDRQRVTLDGASYVVKRGDSLSRIASLHGQTVTAIRLANGLNSDTIFAGQKLRIPNAAPKVEQVKKSNPNNQNFITVTVRSGDTLGAIANRYGVSLKLLAELNNIRNVAQIRLGQVLNVPRKQATIAEKQLERSKLKLQEEQPAIIIDRSKSLRDATVKNPQTQQTTTVVLEEPTAEIEFNEDDIEDDLVPIDDVDSDLVPVDE